jgi:hypothetical protein
MSPPVTPPAPCTSTHSPAGEGAASVSAWSAVSAGTGNAAAVSHATSGGFDATSAAGATSNCAQVPWCRSGSGWVSTSSPGAKFVTSSPTALTTPDASTPSASGGFRPTSHLPTRAISSQLPTPAARTETTSSSGAGDPGAASSSMCTSPPNASMPAACIRPTSTCEDPMGGAGSTAVIFSAAGRDRGQPFWVALAPSRRSYCEGYHRLQPRAP